MLEYDRVMRSHSLLFNLILEYVVRQLDTKGYICNKTSQICAFADDLVILSRRRSALIDITRCLIRAAEEVGLLINAGKTKYMEKCKTANDQMTKLSVDQFDFERVHSFTYLGSIIADSGGNSEEIHARILKGNRSYFLYSYLLKNKLLTKSLKTRLYKTIIRPIVTYGSETWTMTKKDENDLLIFERKVLRRIVGPVNDGGQWRIRHNAEIEKIIKDKNIVRFVKSQRLSWLGHIERRGNNYGLKKIINWIPMGVRPRGRPRKRWKDDVLKDLEIMKIRNWREKSSRRAVWKGIVEQAKANKGL